METINGAEGAHGGLPVEVSERKSRAEVGLDELVEGGGIPVAGDSSARRRRIVRGVCTLRRPWRWSLMVRLPWSCGMWSAEVGGRGQSAAGSGAGNGLLDRRERTVGRVGSELGEETRSALMLSCRRLQFVVAIRISRRSLVLGFGGARFGLTSPGRAAAACKVRDGEAAY